MIIEKKRQIGTHFRRACTVGGTKLAERSSFCRSN